MKASAAGDLLWWVVQYVRCGKTLLYGVVGRVLWYVNFTVAHLCSHSIFYWGVFGLHFGGVRACVFFCSGLLLASLCVFVLLVSYSSGALLR